MTDKVNVSTDDRAEIAALVADYGGNAAYDAWKRIEVALEAAPKAEPVDREDLIQILSDAIDDSFEMDWTARLGAHAVVDVLEKEGLLPQQGGRTSTDALVDRFAASLKDKLNRASEKYGYSDGWSKSDWREELVQQLLVHVEKGDPRDVAAYCAFAWHHGWSIKPEAPKVEHKPFGHWVEHTVGEPVFIRNGIYVPKGKNYTVTHLYTHPAPASDELLEALERLTSSIKCVEINGPKDRAWGMGSNLPKHYDAAIALIANHKGPKS